DGERGAGEDVAELPVAGDDAELPGRRHLEEATVLRVRDVEGAVGGRRQPPDQAQRRGQGGAGDRGAVHAVLVDHVADQTHGGDLGDRVLVRAAQAEGDVDVPG